MNETIKELKALWERLNAELDEKCDTMDIQEYAKKYGKVNEMVERLEWALDDMQILANYDLNTVSADDLVREF